ncbi:MAG: DUF4214 domain-containing protein [Elusimicrobia bacterium]|nr:DUF4214 domain-containing protein [Elusimicrobiota bacterium]
MLEFSGGEYNVYDDLLAYTEKTTENGETKSRVFTNGVFDTKHNMMSYREEATDSKGRTSIKEWNAVGEGKGYVLGELQGYDEVVNYGALVVTSEVRNIHYDALRRQDGNATTKRIKGVETDGGAVDIVLVEDTRVMRSDEARSVRAVGSTDPRSMNIVNVVGGRTEVRTRGTDAVTGELLRDLKETVERSQVTVAGDFKEVRRTEGKDGEDELDSVAETIRTGTVLDGFGRAVTYREETVQNNNPASWMSRVVDRMSYNVDGNLTASHEATLNSLGVVGEVTRTGMLYDQQNRLSEYHMEQVSSAEGATVGSQTHRTGIKYNGLSDVTRYGERVERLGTAVVETGMWSGTYNVLGQVKTSRDETRRGGAVVEEGVTKALDETVLTETWGMRYTKDGVGVRQYKERTGSSATPDLVNFLEVTGATYDAYNRLATFNQTSHRVTAEAAGVVNGAFVFDEGKATLHEVTVTGRTEAVFDGKGALTGYKERTETRDGTGVAGGWTETVRHDIKFHPLGQMVAYEAEERKAESPDLMTAVEWSGSVDAFNRSAGYVEIRQDHHGNGTLGPRSVEARTGLVYNGLAQVEAYERTRRSSDAPDVVTTVTVENATYDTFGNQTGYRETTRTRGGGESNTRVVERSGAAYDRQGLLRTYVETVQDTASAELMTRTERRETTYDLMGRETGSVNLRHEAGRAERVLETGERLMETMNKWTTVVQTGRTFNEAGLTTGYVEATFDGTTLNVGGVERAWVGLTGSERARVMNGEVRAGEAVTVTRRSNMVYNGWGLAVGYQEERREISTTLDHRRTMTRNGVRHNNLHQLTGYTDSWVDNRTPGVSERVEITGVTYNAAGRLVYGHEVKTQTGLLESRVETDRWVKYDDQGRLLEEKTLSKADNGIVEEKERVVSGYNGFGNETGDETAIEERGFNKTGEEVYRISTKTTKTDVYYDDHGRSAGYTETTVASDKPDMETKHVWTAAGYNTNDQLIGFNETWVGISEAGEHETRTTRSGMKYDAVGRMVAYEDRTTGNADDTEETLTWTATGYNGAGLINGSEEVRSKICETPGALYNVETRTTRTNMLYDLAGNLLHYTQTENGTDRPDLWTGTEWDGAYDALGRMARYLEKVRSTDLGTGGQVLSTYEENDRLSMAYDGSNHLVGYTEKTLDKLGNRNERVWTAVYGGRGLVTGYEEIEIDDRGNPTHHNQEGIEYDFAGRVIAVVDIEHDPLNTVTVSERTGIHYDRAGLASGMDEKGTQVDGGGVRTEWTLTQGPILYDLAGRVFLRQEERVKRIYDTDGSLARETVESETFANALYNRLGQAVSHETLIDRRSPDGRLTESERSVLNGATYNRLGQMASYHKEETEEGRSVETLVLPSNWEELGLHPEERLLWLENLTFLVGGAEMALDELGLSLTNGMAVSWADLSSAQKVQLLSSGQTTLNGETFRLAGATIVWEKSTAHSFDQNQMTYSRYGALQHYERSGDENGVGYVQDWTSTGFDVHDRVLGFHEEMKKETQALVVTDRAGTVYDARSLAVAYTETVRDGAAPDLVTVTETIIGHDALKRTVWTQQAIKKNGTGPDGAVDTTTTIWLGNYLYDGFDRAAAYDEVRFGGTTLKIGGAERTWDSLSAGERASILGGSLTPTGQTVEVSRVAGVAYTATDRQSGFARVTRRWGESEMAPGVSGTTALMEETHLVRAGTSFNANQQALGYKEAASSTSEPEVVRLSEVTSLVYNAAGQTAGFDALTRKMGFDLDVLETLERSGVVYNRFGQMAGYFDRTVLNGLNVERFVTGLTYDDQERLTGSRTLTRQFGMESRVYYLQGGRTLTSAEVAALLMAHPGKTLEELLASGVLTQETRMEALDETTLSVTSGLVYDDLNRVIRSVETTFGADGSITTSTLSDIGYDQWGRPAGMTMTIHLGGVVPVTEYVLDGTTLTPEALDALLAQQEQSSGRTAARLMTEWLTSGRLTTLAVTKVQDVTITTLRENMRYNQNGQVVGYRETGRDPANNIALQVSTVAIEYNRAGQASRQTSDVRLDNVDGSWTESQTVLTYRYDAAGRLQGGTSSTASRTVTAVWTDTNQDGRVDRLTTLPESRASSVQEYGVFNGQAQALWQSSRQESANVGGGTSASVSSMVFQYGAHGRLMGALGVMDTRSDDGFGNRTGGAVVQLFGAPGSSLKLLSSVTETVTLGADGGSNHTVLSTAFNYDGSGTLLNARGVGHFNGTEMGLTILDGVREVVETSLVRGRITQEYQIVMNEARVSISTTQTHSEIAQGSVLDQTTVITYLYDAAGRLTGASAVVSGTGTNYGWTDLDEDGDMDAWETAGTMEISGTQTYVVMNGTALVKENKTRQILRAETGSVSTSDMTVRYGYDAVGNLAWAQGTGTVDSVERGWSDTNNDGTVDTLEVAGRTLSEIRQTYAIINNQARVIRSDTTTRGVDPVTGRVLSEGEHGYSRVLTRVEFVYDAVGRLTAADGRSEGRSNVEVWSDADMDGVIDAGEMMDQVTEVATENDYVVIQGSAQVVRSVTQSSMTVGASRSTSVNAMAFEYDRLGRLVGAVGDSFGTTTTKFWNDADADGVVDNGEMLDQVTHAETSNVFRIIRGQAVLLESRSNSSITTALGESQTVSWTRNRYDAAGRLVGATGGATGTSTTQFWNDNDMDGVVDADEMVVQTTTFETFNSYQILLGQAMLSVSRSESATRTPLTQTTTTSVTSYQYNARGQLIGAGGTATGSTTTVVWNDADQDGVMEPGERVPQTTTFNTTNAYRIMAGQAMVSEARTSSLSANGNVRTETLNITQYRYSADGVLIGATGTSTGTTITTVWNDADLDGVMDAGERVGQTTTFTTQSEYRILQGQAMVVRSDTHSVAVAGAATTVTDTRMNYQYNALGVLIGATGSTQGTTTTLVKNEPDGGSGGLVSQTSTFTTSNVYRISQGQAVVLRSTTHTVAVAGTTTTTTDSWTTNTYDRDGLLTGTTGGSSGTSATTVWNDVDMDGVQDGGEMVVQTGTFSSQNTYRVLQGQSVVTASTTHTESVAGTTSTVTDSWMTYRYDNQGMLIGADGASSGSSKTEVWNDADQDRQIDAGEIVLQTQTFSARNTYRVVQGQAVVYESFTHTESVFDNTTTVTDSWVRYQYNAQGILWGATGGATSRATKPVWNDANQNGTIDPGERVTETSTTTTTNTYRIVQGQAVVWEARSHTVTSSGLTTTVSDNWVRYQYNAQGLLVGASGGGSGTTSTTVWNDRDRDGVMDAGELTSTTSTFTSASTYRILQGQAVVSRSTTHTVEVVGGTTTEVDNWMEFRYDARGMLIGATGGASGRRYWSSSYTSSWSESGSTTSGGIVKSFTSVTTSTTNSYYEMRWTANSTYIIFNGTAKPTKTDTRSSYSSQTTTNVVTNKTESWIEKRMEPESRTKTVTTTGKDGKTTTTTVTETVMVEKTYHMTGTTKTTAWSSVYYSGGGTSSQTFLYDAQGQLVGERRHEESWDNPAIVEGGMNTSTTVTSLERGKDGRPITNYTITDGALQSGARVWGVSLSAGSTASINRLSTNAGGWISQLAVNSRGEVEVTLSVFDKVLTPGKGLSWKINPGQQYMDPKALGSITIGLSADDYVNRVEGALTGVRTLAGLMRSKNAEGFRNQAEMLVNQEGGWLESTQMTVFSDNKAFSLTVDRAATGAAQSTLANTLGHLVLGGEASVARGLALLKAVPVVNPDNLAAWGKDLMEDGAILGFRFNLPGFDKKTGSGFALGGSLDGNGSPHITVLQMVDGDEIKGLGVPLSKIGEPKGAPVTTVLVLLKDMESADAAGLGELVGKGIDDGITTGLVTTIASENVNLSPIDNGFGALDDVTTSSITTQPKTTVTDSWVDYRYNEEGLLVGATGGAKGTSTQQVWNDANRDGMVDPGELVSQTSSFTTTNTYRIFHGQAVVVESSTHAVAAGATGTTVTDSWVKYQYNKDGLLVGAAGGTVGTTDTTVWNDANQDGVLGAGEMVEQTSTFSTTNTYRIIYGQAMVYESFTHAESTSGASENLMDSWMRYEYDAGGILVGAIGGASGTTSGMVWNDENQDGVLDAAEMSNQTTTFQTKNRYRIIQGQAVVTWSSTTSTAVKADGSAYGINEHGYSFMTTEVKYRYDAGGLLTGAVGTLSGRQVTTVWTDTTPKNTTDAVGKWVVTPVLVSGTNTYAVIHGQAMVTQSVTTSTAVKADGTAYGYNEHGYSVMTTIVNNAYDNLGRLVGVEGSVEGRQVTTVWTDTTPEISDDQEGEWVVTPVEVKGTNRYVVIQGQAVVKQSVTTTRAVKSIGTAYGMNEHGYSVMTTTVNYTYDALGRLVGAAGTVEGRQVTTVWTDTTPEIADDQEGEWVVTPVEVKGSNTYVVIHGQAVVKLSVTTSTAVKADGTAYGMNEHGYSVMTTIMNFTYDALGRLVAAAGIVEGRQVTTVWTDKNRNNTWDADETVITPVLVSGTNTYAVIQGQAVVVTSETTSTAVKADGTAYGINEHGYSMMTTTVNYSYDALGRLVGATGWTTGSLVQEVFTDTTAGQSTMSLEDVKKSFVDSAEFKALAPEEQVAALYRTVLEREPDTEGFAFWVGQLKNGGTLANVVAGFYGSREYSDLMGKKVDALYRVLLGRDATADVEGRAFWMGVLAGPGGLRAVIAGIMGSEEFKSKPASFQVRAAYEVLLGRPAGTSEVEYWVGEMGKGMTLETVLGHFVASPEYATVIGKKIDALYQSALGRTPDAGGKTYWIEQVKPGAADGSARGNYSLQRVEVRATNTYAVIQGQAVVMASVTTSTAVKADGTAYGINEHGYSVMTTTVNNAYDALGRLTGATGTVTGRQVTTVWTDKNRNNTWDADETVLTPVLVSGTNTYAVIHGQAVVVTSVTTSTAVKADGTAYGINEHGYSVMTTTVNNAYDALGRLTGATGTVTGRQVTTVWTDKNRNNTWDADETVLTPVLVSGTNTYAVIHGQAVVVTSVTTSTAVKADGTAYGINEHGYSVMTTTVNNAYDALGRLTGATGTVTGRQVTTVWTDKTGTTPGTRTKPF